MPNRPLIEGAATQLLIVDPDGTQRPISAVIDGYPEATHKLDTMVGGEPLEDGRQVTDHAVAQQDKLTLTGWVSDLNGGERPRQAWDELRRLHAASRPVRVMTEWGVYPEMIIRSAEAPQTGRGMRFTLELVEVIRVGVQELAPEALSGPAVGRSAEVHRGRVAMQQLQGGGVVGGDGTVTVTETGSGAS